MHAPHGSTVGIMKMRKILPIVIFAVLLWFVSLFAAGDPNDNQDHQSASVTANNKNLTFGEIDRLVDQHLKWKQNGNIDTIGSADNILNLIYTKRDEDRRKATTVLLRMYQHSNVESSEFITQMLNEMFYYHPSIVVSSLNEIESHLLVEHRNENYIDYLIHSSCGIPQIVTEDINFNKDTFNKDVNRIISEIESSNVNNALKTKVLGIVTKRN